MAERFVKLTFTDGSNVFVSANAVKALYADKDRSCLILNGTDEFGNGDLFVKESPAEVLALLEPQQADLGEVQDVVEKIRERVANGAFNSEFRIYGVSGDDLARLVAALDKPTTSTKGT